MSTPPQHPPAPPPAGCLNCGVPLGAPPPHYCPACGQDTRLRAPTLREFAQQFTGQYLSTEGALWRTLALLFLQPGELTRRYIAGRRRHYVLPVRLYLTISLLALLALRLGSGMAIDWQADKAAPRPHAAASAASAAADRTVTVQIFGGRAGLRDGRFHCTDLPAWFCQRLQDRFDQDERGLAREMRRLSERFMANLGAAMFVLVPMFAFWMRVAWRDRRLRYAEHLVYSLHLHAFWFAMLLLAVTGLPWLDDLAVLAMPVYALLASRRVYGGGWAGTLLRNAGVALGYLLTIVVAMLAVGLWSALF